MRRRVYGYQRKTAQQRREYLIAGVDKPTIDNTGIYPNVPLTITSTHTPVSNTTYRNLDIYKVVNLAGLTNVRYENCIFRGIASNPTTASSLVRAFGVHGRGHTFVDCTFQPQVPHYNWNGIQGHGVILKRCRFIDCTDSLDIFYNIDGPGGPGDNSLRNGSTGVVVEQCYFGDAAWWPEEIDTGGGPIGSHTDHIQYQGGTGTIIRGNTFTGMIANKFGPNSYDTYHTNASIMIKPDVGLISNMTIEENWIDGGSYSVNIAHDAPRMMGYIGSISNNRFGRNQRVQGSGVDQTFTISMPDDAWGTFIGNIYDDNGHAIRVRGGVGGTPSATVTFNFTTNGANIMAGWSVTNGTVASVVASSNYGSGWTPTTVTLPANTFQFAATSAGSAGTFKIDITLTNGEVFTIQTKTMAANDPVAMSVATLGTSPLGGN